MATKRDANGQPLCTACLDARLSLRRGAFLLHEGRAPLPASRPAPAPEAPEERPSPAPVRVASATRIARTRERAARAQKVGAPARRHEPPKPRVPPPDRRAARVLDRRFVLLAAELGFVRAQQLLDGMSQAIVAIGVRSGARKAAGSSRARGRAGTARR